MSNILLIASRFTVALFFVLLAGNVFASETDYTKVYHPVINKAELSILQKDYAGALALYREAFKVVPAPFARDYYNAAVCAMLLKDKKQSLGYLEKLAAKGVSIDYLENRPVFDSLQSTKQWRKFKRKYPKYRQQYEKQVNLDLRADLDELYARDQYFRQAKGGLRVYGDTLNKIEAANTKKFLSWVENHGYPGEDLIGVGDTLEQLPRFSIIIQRQTKARKGHDFSKILEAAVQQGRLSPQAAAYLIEQQVGRSKYGSKAYVKINCSTCENEEPLDKMKRYLEENRTEKELLTLEANRKKLGLESFEDYKKKVIYSMTDKRFKLNYAWSVVNYQVPSKEAAKVMLENFVVADAE
ncbi:hypothetical protein ABID22_002737 [Pontibacter aydingkolensis]|uniref:Tetratricopeptide repeat-containing protein n=1 Tax=Pontibacter aydingkolensis TaxID=1911536 RepID=A0ABS7CWS0_9BACT|nr:hypothetical protein [Pontibacter aydingkolensis]MBW7468303.1 hypothetical protein [Pontibacter aydingkolensis]